MKRNSEASENKQSSRPQKQYANVREMKSTTLYRCKFDKSLYRCLDGENLECRNDVSGEWEKVTDNSYYVRDKIFREY